MRLTGFLFCSAGAMLLAAAPVHAGPAAERQTAQHAVLTAGDRGPDAAGGGALILSEPGDVEISIWITPTARSRQLRVQADSGANRRDITIGLSGLDSALQHSFTWWALPAGEYEVVGTMVDSDGAREIVVRSTFKVLDR